MNEESARQSPSVSTEMVEYPLWLQNFITTYQQLGVSDLTVLSALYRQDIEFQDPLHHLHGLPQLMAYFERLYQNLTQCDFVVHSLFYAGDRAAIYWSMTFRHRQLNAGQAISVEGHSQIRGQLDKVIYHRDYFDLGQMLYEQLPVAGALIRWLKRRASQ